MPRWPACLPKAPGRCAREYPDWFARIGRCSRPTAAHACPVGHDVARGQPGALSGLSALARTTRIPGGASSHYVGGSAPPAGSAHDAPGPDGGRGGEQALLLEYDARGAATGTLQQYRSALRVFQRFVAVRTGAPLTISALPPTPERHLAELPAWMHPRLLEYITVQSRGWRLAVRRQRTHALARHLARLLSFQLASAPMTTWAGLTRKGIEAWVDQRLTSGRKPRTVASDVALLSSFCAFLVEVAEIDRSPLQRPLAILLPDMLPRFVPDDIVARLSAQRDLAIAQARTGYQRRQAFLERAVFYVLVDSGLRRSEVVGLTLDDVDLPARRLCVPRQIAARPPRVPQRSGGARAA